MLAVTDTTASAPTFVGLATQVSPLRVSEPLVIDAEIALVGIPGTAIEMGLSIPAYSTFIIVADTVAIGSITVYDELKSRRLDVPSPRGTSM